MRSRISGRDSDDSVDTGRKLVCEAESGAWGSPKSTGGNKFGLELILKIRKILMAKVAEVFMKIPILSVKRKSCRNRKFSWKISSWWAGSKSGCVVTAPVHAEPVLGGARGL